MRKPGKYEILFVGKGDPKYRLTAQVPDGRLWEAYDVQTNDMSWAHEQANKLRAKGSRSIKIQKRVNGKWVTI